MGLVKSIVSHYAPNQGQAQRDDLEQVGFVGLIKAVERYDQASGCRLKRMPGRWCQAKFSTTCATSLRCCGCRAGTVRSIASCMNRTTDWSSTSGESRLGRARDGHERARRRRQGNLAPARLVQPHVAVGAGEICEDAPRFSAIRSTRHQTFRLPIEDRIVLDRAIEGLAEFERRVVELFFYKDLTQTEIARRLGFSQKHISRTLASTLRKLKEEIR